MSRKKGSLNESTKWLNLCEAMSQLLRVSKEHVKGEPNIVAEINRVLNLYEGIKNEQITSKE